jgi:RNA polymerase-interacting CarD/CdnL/TRCF family regulator
MLTPEQLLELVDTMQPVIDELNAWITKDMVRRLMARLSRKEKLELTQTDVWQAQVYKDAGGHMEELQRQIARFTKLSEREIQAIFLDVGLQAYEADRAVYEAAGLETKPLRQSKRMRQILEDTYQRTNGEIRNFTRTTATQSQTKLIEVLDKAHMKVVSGAASYTQAVKEAVDEIAASGQARVTYTDANGQLTHVDTLETAVLRAVRTGTAQASGNMAIEGMKEHDWDIILVSAHLGARYGDGGPNPGNHFWWQGKFYSLNGKTEGLPPFKETTGYGTGPGLSGWNCRHSFGPGDGINNPYKDYDSEENKKAYDLSQRQRRMESSIRKQKMKVLAYREAVDNSTDTEAKQALQDAYDKAALRLQRQNKAYNDFTTANNLKKLSDRLRVTQWTRSEAARASAGARRAAARIN